MGGQRMEFVNVREQCAFVHSDDPLAATGKAGDLVAAAVGAMSLPPPGLSLLHSGASSVEPLAAAMSHDGWAKVIDERVPVTAMVDAVRCRGCEDCEIVCGAEAIHVVGHDDDRIARVDPTLCVGCGVCTAVCSSGAIYASDSSDAQVAARVAGMGDLSDKTLVFSCNWGAYSALEAAGVDRLQYDASVRVARLMCAGRAHPGLILNAFVQGARDVIVLACGHDSGESLCNYDTGNTQAEKSVETTRGMLEVLGIDPGRLTYAAMRPGDGARFVAALSHELSPTASAAGSHRLPDD
jgi:coenzyme F420-reducing hydrogenase delta subunit/ferredoxin